MLINCASAGSGGALTYVRNLIPRLVVNLISKREISVVVLVRRSQLEWMRDIRKDAKFIVVPELPGYVRVIWEHITIGRIVRERQIDVVFTPYQIAPIFRRAVNIVMLRNMEPFKFTEYKGTIRNRLRNYSLRAKTLSVLRNANRVVGVSQFVCDFMVRNSLVRQRSVVRIYHGKDTNYNPVVEPGDTHILSQMGIDSRYIFTSGSLFPYRKCEDVISAFQLLQDKGITLVVAGGGNDARYEKYLRKQIHELGLESRVHLLGHVSQSRMVVLYRNSAVFVTASECEACPNIAIEALSSGCSILSSNVMPLPEIFQDSAEYFEPGDLRGIAEKMEIMLSLPKTVNERAIVRSNKFSWDRCALETCDEILSHIPCEESDV